MHDLHHSSGAQALDSCCRKVRLQGTPLHKLSRRTHGRFHSVGTTSSEPVCRLVKRRQAFKASLCSDGRRPLWSQFWADCSDTSRRTLDTAANGPECAGVPRSHGFPWGKSHIPLARAADKARGRTLPTVESERECLTGRARSSLVSSRSRCISLANGPNIPGNCPRVPCCRKTSSCIDECPFANTSSKDLAIQHRARWL